MKNFLGREGAQPPPRPLPGQGWGNPVPAPLPLLDSHAFGALSIYPRKLPNETKIGTPHFLEQSYAPAPEAEDICANNNNAIMR